MAPKDFREKNKRGKIRQIMKLPEFEDLTREKRIDR